MDAMEEWKKDDEVWKLLGNARPVTVSPYFSRRVRAAIRTTPAPSGLRLLVLRWTAGFAIAGLTLGFFLSVQPQPATVVTTSPEFLEVFDSAAGLDKIAAVEDFTVTSYANGL